MYIYKYICVYISDKLTLCRTAPGYLTACGSVWAAQLNRRWWWVWSCRSSTNAQLGHLVSEEHSFGRPVVEAFAARELPTVQMSPGRFMGGLNIPALGGGKA